jgi:hypothetical protein
VWWDSQVIKQVTATEAECWGRILAGWSELKARWLL